MNVALDIDGTITRNPDFFAIMSRAIRAAGGKVYVVTSRAQSDEVRAMTRRELLAYGVELDDLVIIPDAAESRIPCPHQELDWFQQYLWQKVSVCLDRDVDVVFDDDPRVLDLFRQFAPKILTFRPAPESP